MSEFKILANNKKARYEYFIEDTYEAGIVLKGTEVKSIRMGKVSIKESYAEIDDGEVFVVGMNVTPYENGNRFNVEALRKRKLLLHKREINKLIGYTTQKGFTLIPLRIYLNAKGLVKMELAVAKGKKLYDKRDSIAKREANIRINQAMSQKY